MAIAAFLLGFLAGICLIAGIYLAAEGGGLADRDMSAEASALMDRAEIAECMAGEARQMAAGWMLDMKSSSGYVSTAYESEMAYIIAAGTDSADAMEAWAGAAKQAADDGSITAAERATVKDAERRMSDASAAVYDAFMSTSAGQLAGATTSFIPGFTEAYMQAAALSGEATECY